MENVELRPDVGGQRPGGPQHVAAGRAQVGGGEQAAGSIVIHRGSLSILPSCDRPGRPPGTGGSAHGIAPEGGSTWDQMAIQASSDGGVTWATVWTRATAATAGFVVDAVDGP